MARKISFRERVAECIEKSDVSSFQHILTKRLNESLNVSKVRIISEIASEDDTESQIVSEITGIAASYGGSNVVYSMGTMNIKFDNKDAVQHFTDQLDDVNGVDYYEIDDPTLSNESDDSSSLENQGLDLIYDVTIYLDTDNVSFVPDINTYLDSLDTVEESRKAKCAKDKSKKEKSPPKDEDDPDEEDDWSDDGVQKESLEFSTILDNVALNEFITVKTAHWDQALKRAKVSTDKICPPGRTGPDCKSILTAQQKMELRKRLAAHLKRLSGKARGLMASHASSTRAFIKQHNLMSKSAARARM